MATECAGRIIDRVSSEYGYPLLKKEQKSILYQLLSGHDVFGCLPTGYGKSVCFILTCAHDSSHMQYAHYANMRLPFRDVTHSFCTSVTREVGQTLFVGIRGWVNETTRARVNKRVNYYNGRY